MTKFKCDNCGEKHDRMHIIIECSNCYVNGWKKQWKRDRGVSSSQEELCKDCGHEREEHNFGK